MREGKEFIIRQSSNAGSVQEVGKEVLTQKQRKLLGMSKPHMLGKQNELIQQMLNMKDPSQTTQLNDTSTINPKRLHTISSFGTASETSSKQQRTTDKGSETPSAGSQTTTKAKKRPSQVSVKTKSQHNDLFTFKMPESYYKDPKPTQATKPPPFTQATMNPRLRKGSDEEDGGLLSERQLE